MNSFWETALTVKAREGNDYSSYTVFGIKHLTELFICFAFIALSVILFRKCNKENRKKFLTVLSALILLDEVGKYIMTVATGQWDVSFLPLHLCSINIFVCVADTVKRNKYLEEILYSLCLPGAIIALLFPSWISLPFFSFMHIHSVSVHTLLALYPILRIADGFKPSAKRIPVTFAILLAVCVPISFINKALGTNFFFISGSQSNVLSAFFASTFLGEKYYLIGFAVTLLLLWLILYLPWEIYKKQVRNGERNKKRFLSAG